MSVKQLEDAFAQPQRSKIPIPISSPTRPTALQRPVPSTKIKKPIYLPRLKINTIEDNIVKGVRNLFRLKSENDTIFWNQKKKIIENQ